MLQSRMSMACVQDGGTADTREDKWLVKTCNCSFILTLEASLWQCPLYN